MNYTEVTENIADRVVDGFKTIEDAGSPILSTVGNVTAPVRERLSTLPGVDALPTPKEIVTANTALVERLVAAQRDFVVGLLDQVTAEPAKKPAPKAKKAASA